MNRIKKDIVFWILFIVLYIMTAIFMVILPDKIPLDIFDFEGEWGSKYCFVKVSVGMAVSLPKLAESMGLDSSFNYSMKEYLLLFAITITAVFALAAMLLIISTLSKDVKQATSVAPVVMMVLMIGGMLATTEGFKPMIEDLGMVNNLIPAWNTMILMQDIINLEYTMNSVWISCGINLLFSVVSIYVIGKCFESEKILNG